MQFALPSGLENGKDHQCSTVLFYLSIGKKQLTSEFLWIDSTGITTGISDGIPAEKQMDSAYDFFRKNAK